MKGTSEENERDLALSKLVLAAGTRQARSSLSDQSPFMFQLAESPASERASRTALTAPLTLLCLGLQKQELQPPAFHLGASHSPL